MAVIALQISRVYRIILVLLSVGLLVFLYATYANNGPMNFTLQMVSDDASLSASPLIATINLGKVLNDSVNQSSVVVRDNKLLDTISHTGIKGR